jgi:signal transduction histidine kinase
MRKIFAFFVFTILSTVYPQVSAQKLHWRIVDSPTQEEITDAKRLSKSLGYIHIKNKSLFKFKQNKWHAFPLPRGVLIEKIIVVAEDDIWAVVQAYDQYRQGLMHYAQDEWQHVSTPNIDVFKAFYFESPDLGWAGCNWGEILQFMDGEWRQVRSPTRCHIERFFKGTDGEIFALTDCSGGGGSQVLVWNGKFWDFLLNEEFPNLSNGLVTRTGEYWFWDNAATYTWNGEKLAQKEDYPAIQRVAIFPKGDGYLFTPDTVFYFSSFSEKIKTPVTIDDRNHVRGITLAEDGSGWLFGHDGKLWGLDEIHGNAKSVKLRFNHYERELGRIMGSAILQINPERRDLYLVEHEKPNFLIHNVEQKSDFLKSVTAGRLHNLDEMQKTIQNNPVYDFAVLAGDFNSDRKEDIFLTSLYGANCLFLNAGQDKFIDATDWAGLKVPGGRYSIAATADIDNDGDLDLFVPDEMGVSQLFVNNGHARFTEEAERRGALVPYAAKASCFGDIDADGWIDLAVTTYQEGTYLFRNAGQGYFEEIGKSNPALNPAQPEKCSSLAFADYDNDGDLDLFISKMLASNCLLQNDGAGNFKNVTREAGLLDSSLSRGAVFFDPDQDGDLDLFISNMGHDAFYINNGSGQYSLNSSKMNHIQPSWLPSEYIANFAGAISNGTVVLDHGGDGDPDLFVGRFDGKSLLFSNTYNQRDYLVFRLFGTKANYSAVGATVKLYPSGKNFDPGAILGARIIESTSGYGSHSEKWIHFGVDSTRTYDAEILFPGGERVLLADLSAGQSYRIDELRGLPYFYEIGKKQILTFLFGFRSELRQLNMLLFGLLITLIFLPRNKLFWGERTARYILLSSFFFGFFLAHRLYVYQSDLIYFLVPLIAGLALAAMAIFTWKAWRLRNMPQATFQALSLKLSGFSHSENYANVLASIELHLNNIKPDEQVDRWIVDRCRQAFQIAREQMHPEIQTIIAFSRTLKFQVERAYALHAAWRRLLSLLKKVGNGFEKQLAPAPVVIDQLKSVLQEVKMHVRSLDKTVQKRETSDPARVIAQVIKTHQKKDVEIHFNPAGSIPRIHFPADELSTVLDELIANALRAMRHCAKKEITLETQAAAKTVDLEIRDTGTGIRSKLWQEIFKRKYSTKERGGLGLHLIKQIIERYGGDIQVKTSSPAGTTFLLTFEKAHA